MDSINKVNKLNKSDFISIFGNVFEKTEWIAERVFNYLPYKNFLSCCAVLVFFYLMKLIF